MSSDGGERESRDYRVPFRIAGSRGSSDSLPDMREEADSVRPVANLLLAAAHADGTFCAQEQATVRGLLCQLLGAETLPLELEAQLRDFDPAIGRGYRARPCAGVTQHTASSHTCG